MTPNVITSEHEFWNWTDAAGPIFKHVREHPELRDGPWGFDRGGIADGGIHCHAVFSHVAISGWGHDRLIVRATKLDDGTWELAHTIERAK